MLNIKNNIIFSRIKKFNVNSNAKNFNQLVMNTISIFAIALLFAIIYMLCLKYQFKRNNLNNNFGILEISKTQNIYIDRKSIFNKNLGDILKNKHRIIFKVPNNINYNLLCKIYTQVKLHGFKNIIFTKN